VKNRTSRCQIEIYKGQKVLGLEVEHLNILDASGGRDERRTSGREKPVGPGRDISE